LKYIDEFRDGKTARLLADAIREAATGRESTASREAGASLKFATSRQMTFMEVCGTHTMNIARFGIRGLLPESIRLISGPGCPVCVTPHRWIDHAIALARKPEVTLAVFGDMMRVPGSTSSLEFESAGGADVRVVASTLEALDLARRRPEREVVFMGVGFETTSPTVAVSVLEAQSRGLSNYSVLCAHKLMPPALNALSGGNVRLDGYLCPGHVSAILGWGVYEEIVRNYGIGCVIAGFEPLDILQAILMLVRQIREGVPKVENPYSRAVTREGNVKALQAIHRVFELCDSEWRGLGVIPQSGLKIRSEYAGYDAALRIPAEVEPTREPEGCKCGEVLMGTISPPECGLFGKACTPDRPVGACMVSVEGTCAAFFRYGVGLKVKGNG
jgi:hydrogenase expression/formation protein HypD